MRKIFLFLLVGLFLISSVSAADYSYNDTIKHGFAFDTVTNANTVSGMIISVNVTGSKLVRIDKNASDGSTAFAIRTSPSGANLSVTNTCGTTSCILATPLALTINTYYYIVTNQSGALWDIIYMNADQAFPAPASLNGTFVTGFNQQFWGGALNRTVSIVNFTLSYAAGTPLNMNVTLNSPSTSLSTSNASLIFNSTQSASGGNLTNATIYIYYNNGTLFNKTTNNINGTLNTTTFNISSFTANSYLWDVYTCANNVTNTACNVSGTNRTFVWGVTINSRTYNNPVLELTSQTFTLNTTLFAGLISSQATLIYNNTNYIATATTSGSNTIFTRSINVPDLSVNTGIPFVWQLALTDASGTITINDSNFTQTSQILSVDDCSSNTLRILNYTLRDEDTDTIIYPTGTTLNSTIQVQATFTNPSDSTSYSIFNQSYTNKTNAIVCLSAGALTNSSYILDVLTSYQTSTRVLEFHNIQQYNLTNTTANKNTTLYDLTTATSQEFLITFKDNNFLPVDNALIDITRQYISQGVFKSVEVPKTDPSGQTLGHFVLSDSIYTIIVSKNGVILGTFNNIRANCNNQATGDCKINLNQLGSNIDPSNFNTFQNIKYSISFSQSTRTITALFSTLDGTSSTVSLNGTKFDNYGNQTVCSQKVTSSTGTLTCVIPASFGNVTVLSQLYNNNKLVTQSYFTIKQTASQTFGSSRFLMVLLLAITLPLMALTSGVATLIFALIGVALASLLNFSDTGILGISATIGWLLIAILLVLWKASRSR